MEILFTLLLLKYNSLITIIVVQLAEGQEYFGVQSTASNWSSDQLMDQVLSVCHFYLGAGSSWKQHVQLTTVISVVTGVWRKCLIQGVSFLYQSLLRSNQFLFSTLSVNTWHSWLFITIMRWIRIAQLVECHSWSKGCGFDSWQERQENVLLWS